MKTALTNPMRNKIVRLLSDEEIRCIAARDIGPPLAFGEEYVDLTSLEKGVIQADEDARFGLGDIVPRASVEPLTWSRICSRLERAMRRGGELADG